MAGYSETVSIVMLVPNYHNLNISIMVFLRGNVACEPTGLPQLEVLMQLAWGGHSLSRLLPVKPFIVADQNYS